MSKPQDLTGQTFGLWTVEEKLPSIKKIYSSGSVHTLAQYRCRCQCGTVKILGTSSIKNSKSCGCRRKEILRSCHEQDLTGKRFGKLVVKKKIGKIKDDNYSSIWWLCQCDCGNETKSTASRLNSGNTTSCGCMKRYRPIKLLPIGYKFGKSKIVEKISGDKYDNIIYKCKCACGNLFEAKHKNIISGHTKSCGCLHKEQCSINGKACLKDITGMRFGKLIALERVEYDGQGSKWKCRCDCGNITYVLLGNLKEDGGGTISCGCASSKGNIVIENYLKNHNYKYDTEFSFEDLKGINNGLLRFDAVVFNNDGTINSLIEYDGEFHYSKQYSEDGYEMIIEHDKRKNAYCKNKNYNLIRIPYWDFENIENILDKKLSQES